MLEDLADVMGSIDEAVTRAIQREHAQVFGEEPVRERSQKVDLNELIRAIEQRIAGLLAASPINVPAEPKRIELEMPPIQATEATESSEEPLSLDSVLDSIIIAEVDLSEPEKKEEGKAADEHQQ